MHGTRVAVPVKRKGPDGELVTPPAFSTVAVQDFDGNTVTLERPTVPEVRDADVWHCSLSLRAEEGKLSDEKRGQVSEAFVRKMGFAGFEECGSGLGTPTAPRTSWWATRRASHPARGQDGLVRRWAPCARLVPPAAASGVA